MNLTELTTRRVEKPWGRHDLLPGFEPVPAGTPAIGEIWFEDPAGRPLPLMIKYLFISERLSIQVHPGDAAAQAAGYRSGKEEAWLVLEAEPDATIGIGLVRPTDKEALRSAALDGSIEELIDWKPAKAGDVLYSPAGTIHALGPGLKLIEVQQNVDLTYRLYDYGRPRELHLDAGIEASEPEPYRPVHAGRKLTPEREILTEGGKFVVERWNGPMRGKLEASAEQPAWLVPLSSGTAIGTARLDRGTTWLAEGSEEIALSGEASLLVAYEGACFRDILRETA